MVKRLLVVVLVLCLLGVTACTSNKQREASSGSESFEPGSPSQNDASSASSDNSSDTSGQKGEIPSLTITVEGESVLLVDMDDPFVRDFFSGCGGYDVDSLDITVTSMETRQETPVHIDPRYTYPMYTLDMGGHEGGYLELAEKLLSGEKMAGYIVNVADTRQWEGILFDDEGFPVSIGMWGDEGYGHYAPVVDEMNRYEAPDRVEAFVNYFGGHILIMTDEIRGELEKHGFDMSRTTVKAGWFGYPGFYFTDGERELIRVTGDTKQGYYTSGAYITPVELGKDAIDFEIEDKARREAEPPLAPGENPPTG